MDPLIPAESSQIRLFSDHPMGGGEGRNAGGHPRSRNGMPAKGYKTRSKTKYSEKFIIERRKKQNLRYESFTKKTTFCSLQINEKS